LIRKLTFCFVNLFLPINLLDVESKYYKPEVHKFSGNDKWKWRIFLLPVTSDKFENLRVWDAELTEQQ